MQPGKTSMLRFFNGTMPVFEENLADPVSPFAEINFGAVRTSEGEKAFSRQLNQEILLLCRSLPPSTHSDAVSFLIDYAGISFKQEINFFKNYYVPAWSVIYWIIDACPQDKKPTGNDVKHAVRAHAMALFLHSLDDHLNDGQMPVSHLSLLLRSQAWMRMRDSLEHLYAGVNGGQNIADNFFDDYYFSICDSQEFEDLDGYCTFFRKQMATWLIVPVLLAEKTADDGDFTGAIQSAYESFGIAWRLLDDLQDTEKDMLDGAHSAIYYSLTQDLKNAWDKKAEDNSDCSNEYTKTILEFVLNGGVIDRIKRRICSELESAAAFADSIHMANLKSEFCAMLKPLK